MTAQTSLRFRIRDEVSDISDWGPIRAICEVLIVALSVGFAMMPLLPAYGTEFALNAVIAGVACGAGVALIGAFARWALPLTLVVGFASYVVVGSFVAFSTELTWGFLPSGTTMTRMLVGVVTSWKEALTLEPPLGSSDGVLVLPFLIAFTGSFLAALVVIWRRSWATTIVTQFVVALVLIVSILWGTQDDALGAFIGIGTFFSLMLWAAWRMGTWKPKRWLSLTAFLAAILAGSFFITPALEPSEPRFVLRSVVVPPFDPRDQISPLALYRSYVKDRTDDPLVTVQNIPEGALIRLATLDAYDGVVWSVSGDHSRAGSGAFRRIGDRIEQTEQGEPFDVTITINELSGVWTPTIGYLSSVDFTKRAATDFRFNDATGAAVSIGGVSEGMQYRLRGVLPASPSDEALGEAGVGKISIADAANTPEIIATRAVSVAREAANVPLVLRKFEEYLNTRGYFSHGEAAGGYPSLSGHGADRMADLFSADIMVGDAEQYASAMALMARSQGIPSRVVVGFIPNEGQVEETFTGADMSAWVEVYYNDYGWISYFPTPPESQTPKASDLETQIDPEPEAIQMPPDPNPPVTPPAINSEDTDVDADEDERGESIDWAGIIKVVVVYGVPLALLLAIPAAILLLKFARRRRRQRLPASESVIGGWQEFIDCALDLGIRPDRGFTRRETARFIDPMNPRGAVRALADAADRAHFGVEEYTEEDRTEYWREVTRAQRELAQSRPAIKRFLSRFSVRSLRERRFHGSLDPYAHPLAGEEADALELRTPEHV